VVEEEEDSIQVEVDAIKVENVEQDSIQDTILEEDLTLEI